MLSAPFLVEADGCSHVISVLSLCVDIAVVSVNSPKLQWFYVFPCVGGRRRQPEEDAADGARDSEWHLQRCQH